MQLCIILGTMCGCLRHEGSGGSTFFFQMHESHENATTSYLTNAICNISRTRTIGIFQIETGNNTNNLTLCTYFEEFFDVANPT